jgi:tol-pal system protein YbgF
MLAGVALPLGLGACASDDAGRRALAETTTLRAQLDEVKQREEANSRELARVQSQVRGLEADAGEKTREIRAAGVELARARVLLEEARAQLRERAAAPTGDAVTMPATPVTPTAAAPTPVTPAAPSAPVAAPAAPAPPPSAPPPYGASPHTVPVIPPRTTAATPPVPLAPPPATTPRTSTTPPVVSTPPATSPATSRDAKDGARSAKSAEQLFSAAMANFRAQEPGQAVLELTDLIARFPDHKLAPAAQLWIGEAYYQQRDYRQALIELRRVLDAYPKSPQVADALLKSGLCHRALGDRAAARTAWEQVVRDHSSSAAAGQARSLLGTRESAARSGR